MTEPNYLRYYDERYGDLYEIYLTPNGSFLSAARSVEAIGREPIYYDKLNDIPQFHRHTIETLIEERLKNGG
jgi:hypothetical protein